MANAGLRFAGAPSKGTITATFRDGAPSDRFVIQNNGSCPIAGATLTIDLKGSRGRLIFDTTAGGPGSLVYQPLRIVEGQAALASGPTVADGAESLTLNVGVLGGGDRIVFTIDVDDRESSVPTIVDGAEIAGAVIKLSGIATARATFTDQGEAVLAALPCALS
ncbi:MAG: aggregation factor core [Pseudomonadota bacterium]